MKQNTKTNNLIRNVVMAADFVILGVLFYAYVAWGPGLRMAQGINPMLLCFLSMVALSVAEYFYSTVIHRRYLSSEQVLRQVTLLVFSHCVLSYLIMKTAFVLTNRHSPHSLFYIELTYAYYPAMVLARFIERWAIKRYRALGGNSRTAILVGSDPALLPVYEFLVSDPATGYRVAGYYANHAIEGAPKELRHLGNLADLNVAIDLDDMPVAQKEPPEDVGKKHEKEPSRTVPDELYCSLSWTKRDEIYNIIRFCDQKVIHFYFVPVQAESFGHTLKIEQIGETIGYTNYIDPLQLPTNRLIKRVFDVLFSGIVLLFLIPLYPIIALIIKIQSPGPVLFKQLRTGLNGQSFYCYKFRSMHVNKDADKVQATKNDPRKFPFGNFMRKTNIDELPQFWNVFRGEMSIVGPRPHMLAHTEQYSQLINKYMVRHFVKPGVTGWAQVTGFRGETQELWQMEGRVKRDIWYIENWSIWLDLRIIWRTAKQIIVHDEHAY